RDLFRLYDPFLSRLFLQQIILKLQILFARLSRPAHVHQAAEKTASLLWPVRDLYHGVPWILFLQKLDQPGHFLISGHGFLPSVLSLSRLFYHVAAKEKRAPTLFLSSVI